MAKTRIIWISNPIWGRLSEHNYGVESIKELFQTQQDISRIDFAVAAAGEDVSDELINKRHKEKFPHKYTSKLCHNLVMFAWSRLPENIKFTKAAEDVIMDMATQYGKEYSPDIPLVIGAEMRIKLARLSAALAARLYSVDSTGENLIIYPEHTLAICEFIENSYSSNVMGYKDYSDQRKREREIGDTRDLDDKIQDPELISMLLDSNKFQLRDIEDIFGLGKTEALNFTAYLRKNKIMRKLHTFYVKTPAFIYYLKKRKSDLEKSGKKPDGYFNDPFDKE